MPTKTFKETANFNIFTNLKRFWEVKKLRGLAIASIAVNFGVYAAKSIFIPVLITKEMSVSTFYVGLFATAYAIPHFLQFYFGKKCDINSSGKVIFYAIIVYAILMILLSTAPSIHYVIAAGFFLGLSLSAWSTGAICYLSEIGEKNKMEGSIFGTMGSITYFGIFLGYLISGMLASYISTRFLFIIYGTITLIGAAFATKYLLSKEKVVISA